MNPRRTGLLLGVSGTGGLLLATTQPWLSGTVTDSAGLSWPVTTEGTTLAPLAAPAALVVAAALTASLAVPERGRRWLHVIGAAAALVALGAVLWALIGPATAVRVGTEAGAPSESTLESRPGGWAWFALAGGVTAVTGLILAQWPAQRRGAGEQIPDTTESTDPN